MEDTEGTNMEEGAEKSAAGFHGIRLRIHVPKRQTPSQRLKRRLYYRRNRARIVMKRRRYLRTHRSLLKVHRKLFKRYRPSWLKKPARPHKGPKQKKFKVSIPHMVRTRKPSVSRKPAPHSFGTKRRRHG